MILRRKALSTKQHIDSQGLPPNRSPNVYFVALTSCDKYGRPEFPTCLFDASTKRSFTKDGIQVITVHDLVQDFKKSRIDWDGKSDLFERSTKADHKKDERLTKVFEEASRKYRAKEMYICEFRKMMEQNGINLQNAVQEVVRRFRNPNLDISLPDVYILLYSFIQRHRNDHIFVDEVSILHSKSSKLKIFYLLFSIRIFNISRKN